MKNFKVQFKIRDKRCAFSCIWINEDIRNKKCADFYIKSGENKKRIVIGSSSFPELKIDGDKKIHFFLQGRDNSRNNFITSIKEEDFNECFGVILAAMKSFDHFFKVKSEDVPSVVDYYGEIIEINETTFPLLMKLFGVTEKDIEECK